MNLNTSQFEILFNLERLKNISSQLYSLERSFCYKDFIKSAHRCFEIFKESGLSSVEIIPIPADGESSYMDLVMPQAWDVEEASLTVILPDINEPEITSRRYDIFCVANWCPPTPPEGITADLVTWEDVLAGAEIKGRIVLSITKTPFYSDIHREAVLKGAVGLITSASWSEQVSPDSTYWINGCGYPNWYHTKEDTVIPCFSIPLSKAKKLREMLQQNGQITVNMLVNSRLYDGEIYSITGVIPGEEPDEISLIAHIYEPFMTDNHVSAAALAEIARMLTLGINKSKFARLRKSIRFIITFERYGLAHFYNDKYKREQTLLALNLDGICCDIKRTGTSIYFCSSTLSLPFCTDLLFFEEANKHFKDYPIKLEYGNYEDDTFIADKTIGIPTHYITTRWGCYHHNSLCEFDHLVDWNIAEKVTCFIAAYIHSLASASYDVLGQMLKKSTELGKKAISLEFYRISNEVETGSISAEEAILFLHQFGICQKNRIDSFKKFDSLSGYSSAISELSKAIEYEFSLFADKYKLSIQRLNRAERIAKNIIVTRNGIGLPASQVNVPVNERFSHPYYYDSILNFFDGESNLLDAMRKCAVLYHEKRPPANYIIEIIRYFLKLERFGYVTIRYIKRYCSSEAVNRFVRKDQEL